MQKVLRISGEISVGRHPSLEELTSLLSDGHHTVVHFRRADDGPCSPDPDVEREVVQSRGCEYVELELAGVSLDSATVDRFRAMFGVLRKPVFAHCLTGEYARAIVLAHLACERGWTGGQTVERSEAMGVQLEHPQLQEFVRRYVDSHTA